MASPGQLVDLVAAATGVPRPTVAEIDRRLARAGLRASGGRGLSAAKMTATDAAHLLLGVMVGLEGAETASLVEQVAGLPNQDDPERGVYEKDWDLSWVPGPRIVPSGDHSLGDLLATLLDAAKTGLLQKAMVGGIEAAKAVHPDKPDEGLKNELLLSVDLHGRQVGPAGSVMLCLGFGEYVRYGLYQARGGGLLQSRTIGFDVVLTVGEGLANREPNALDG